MSSPYRALLARPGAKPLLAASGIAWFSYSIYGLGLVLTIEHGTGSFGAAGATIAAFSAGSAALAPARGRAVDRHGPSALLALAVVHVAAVLTLIAGAVGGAQTLTLALIGAAAGASVPPLIAISRTRWTRVAGADLAPAAHAANAALGEVMQVAGPLAIAGAVLFAPPAVPVTVLLAGLLAATVVLARADPMSAPAAYAAEAGEASPAPGVAGVAGPDAAPGAAGRRIGAGRRSLRPPGGVGLAVLAAGELLLAVAFGALDVALPAIAHDGGGTAAAAAIPLAVLAASSAAAALAAGSGRAGRSARARFTAGLAIAAGGLLLVAVAAEPLARLAACVPAGAGLGLAFAAVLELLDHVVPAERATEAFTWLTSAGGIGAAAGAAIAGLLADDPSRALLVAPAAVALAAGIALAGERSLSVAGGPLERSRSVMASGTGSVAAGDESAGEPVTHDHPEDQRAAPTSASVG